MGESHHLSDRQSIADARIRLSVYGVLFIAGIVLAGNVGRLPSGGELPATKAQATLAGDLALYQDVVAAVRDGNDYYDVASELLPKYGFPTTSPLNWRLPTYAWFFSMFPSIPWIRAPLILLSLLALGLTGTAHWRISRSAISTCVLVLLMFGVVSWTIDGQAYLAQEPWVAALIAISISTFDLGRRGPYISVVAGVTALFFRELALPYCLIAMLMAAVRNRWTLAGSWCLGISAFLVFFAWHVHRVQNQLAATEDPISADLGQWLRLGGLHFVLLTVRMNQWLFAAPLWVLWIYLLAAMGGLAAAESDRERLCCFAALAYLALFAVLGRPENFYWGLLTAPLFPWGIVGAPPLLFRTIRIARG